jgi:hypothetical protein
MKVPVYDSPQVAPQESRVPVDSVSAPDHSAADRAIAQAGQAVDVGVAAYSRAAEKARQQAIASTATDAETAFTKAATAEVHGDSASGTPGFMQLQGRAAEAEGGPVMQRIEKHRQDIANGLTNEQAKKLFLQRTGGQVESYRAGVETYVTGQRRVADVATLKARADAGLESIRANWYNLGEAEHQTAALEGPIRALALSPEDAEADVKRWHGAVAATQVDSQLDRGDWQSAEVTLKNKGAAIEDKARSALEARLDKVKSVGAAEALAGHIVSSATSAIGEVNQTAVLNELNRLPPDEQAKVRPIVFQRLTEQEQAFAADTKRVGTAAFTLYNRVGWAAFSKSDVADELNQRDPALYNRLQNDAQSEADRLERKRRGTAEDRRAQTQVDAVALNQFLSLTPEERSETDTESWAKGRGMSPVAVSSLGKLKEQAAEVVTRGQATSEGEFVKRAVADAESTFETGTTPQAKARRRAQIQEHEAKARRWFSEWVSEHKGHAPTDAEAADQSGKFALGRVPIGDEGAAAAADVIVRRGTQKVRVLPELDFSGGGAAKPTKADRAKALKATGLSNADIAKKMTAEGY